MLSRPVELWDRDLQVRQASRIVPDGPSRACTVCRPTLHLQVRRTFARHGEVAAVEWRWSGGILRLLVSFKVMRVQG